MADQPSGGAFMKSFLPGLALGLVIGALAGAFIGPMLSNPPEPVAHTKGGTPIVIPPPPGTFDERAPVKPEAPADEKKTPDGETPAKAPADGPKTPETKPAEPPTAPK